MDCWELRPPCRNSYMVGWCISSLAELQCLYPLLYIPPDQGPNLINKVVLEHIHVHLFTYYLCLSLG